MDKLSYALGLNIGHQLSQMGAKGLNIDDFAQAIKDVIAGNTPQLADAEAQTILQKFFQDLEEKQRAAQAEAFKAVKKNGEDYLAENAKKDGVITLPSGLQYQVLKEGNGRKPKATDTVKCHYEGMLVDGTMFDSSIQRGEPAEFPLEWRDRRMDRRSAAHAGGCQVSLLHSLHSRLRRARRRTVHPSLRSPHLRRGAYRGEVKKKKTSTTRKH